MTSSQAVFARMRRSRPASAAVDVLDVELDPLLPGDARPALDLGPAGDPRADLVAAALAGGVVVDLSRDRRPRPDYRHRWRSSGRGRRSRLRSTTTRPRQRRRHEVRPGITGWAQVQGRAGIPWEERIELDVEYVDRRGVGLDLRILAKTAWLLVTGHGLGARLDPSAGGH